MGGGQAPLVLSVHAGLIAGNLFVERCMISSFRSIASAAALSLCDPLHRIIGFIQNSKTLLGGQAHKLATDSDPIRSPILRASVLAYNGGFTDTILQYTSPKTEFLHRQRLCRCQV